MEEVGGGRALSGRVLRDLVRSHLGDICPEAFESASAIG